MADLSASTPPRISPYRADIVAAATAIGWDPRLLEAQVWVESSSDPWAFRYEPAFWRHYLQRQPQWQRWGPLAACSYGLGQVIFATAVDHGYLGAPQGLFDVRINLQLMCGILHRLQLQLRSVGTAASDTLLTHAVLASYNGGMRGNLADGLPDRNGAYAQRVRAMEERLG